MWFMIKIRNNKDLLTLKVFGYSNLKIFFILALTSFVLGWIILLVANLLPLLWQSITNKLNPIILETLII